jgi:hypothetical protein
MTWNGDISVPDSEFLLRPAPARIGQGQRHGYGHGTRVENQKSCKTTSPPLRVHICGSTSFIP